MNRTISRRTAALISAGVSVTIAATVLSTYGWRTEVKADVTLELSAPPANPALTGTTMSIPEGNAAIITSVSGSGPWLVHATVSTLSRYRLRFTGIEHTMLVSSWRVKDALAGAAGVPDTAAVTLHGAELFQ